MPSKYTEYCLFCQAGLLRLQGKKLVIAKAKFQHRRVVQWKACNRSLLLQLLTILGSPWNSTCKTISSKMVSYWSDLRHTRRSKESYYNNEIGISNIFLHVLVNVNTFCSPIEMPKSTLKFITPFIAANIFICKR